MLQRILIAISILVLVGAGLFLFQHGQTPPSIIKKGSQVGDVIETTAVPPGDIVTIPRVVFSKPGFVMIHRADGDNSGEIVMTGDLLPAGESKNVVVHTGIKTKIGEEYFAMLHVDDGNGRYDDPGTDPPVFSGRDIVQKKLVIAASSSQDSVDYQAGFAIFTNGFFRIFTASMYHNLSKDVYIQADNPNITHVKKRGVTWDDFFKTLPFKLTTDCLITGTKEMFCTNENVSLKFYLNGVKINELLVQEIQEGDRVLITYGNENEEQIQNQLRQVVNPR